MSHYTTHPVSLSEVFWNSLYPQKKENQYSLFILHLSLATVGKDEKKKKKKKKALLQRILPWDGRDKNVQRGEDSQLSTQAHFILIQRKWKSPGHALHVCCLAGRWEKKEVERFKRSGKGLKRHASMGAKNHSTFAF